MSAGRYVRTVNPKHTRALLIGGIVLTALGPLAFANAIWGLTLGNESAWVSLFLSLLWTGLGISFIIRAKHAKSTKAVEPGEPLDS